MDPDALPFLNAHFKLVVDDVAVGAFSECTGLTTDVTVEEYAEGGENRFSYKFPTRASASPLVLKRGSSPTQALWDWFDEFRESGTVRPRNGLVELFAFRDGDLRRVRAWSFIRGFPIKISGPDLNASSAAVAIESVEIAHHGIALVRGRGVKGDPVPILIREIVSEITLTSPTAAGNPAGAPSPAGATSIDPAAEERIVRRAVARVLEQLRNEWDG